MLLILIQFKKSKRKHNIKHCHILLQAKRGVFSAFGGFGKKAPPSSFDFLANLTNGSKPTNGSPSNKSDTVVSSSSSVFNSSPSSATQGAGLFSIPVSTTSSTKSTFVMPTTQTSSLFGGMSTTASSVFTASKADSTVGNFSFKPQPSSTESTSKTDSTSAVSSTMFGIPPNNTETKKSLFSTAATSTPFKIQPVTSTLASSPSSITAKDDTKNTEEKGEVNNQKKMLYYTKLKGLNESVSDWIKSHVEKTPLCILTPIFNDYEKYLKEIMQEYNNGTVQDSATKKHSDNNKAPVETKSEPSVETKSQLGKTSPFTGTGNSLFSNSSLGKTTSSSLFSAQPSPNSFGEKASTASSISSPSNTPKAAGFSFGINTSPLSSTSTTNTTPAPFSFGIGKPFTMNNFNAPKPADTENKDEEADDEPPKVEYTPVVEKDSIYEKKCKIFVKKDGNFADRGVGTLYIKKIEDSGKHQLLVRANTNLGNVMVNLILAAGIPTQRMGKNNVMMVCIPTPDAKPPPTPILIRVKTSEEADELLETLNKYKV